MSAKIYGIVFIQLSCTLTYAAESAQNLRVSVPNKIIGGVDTDIRVIPFMLSLMINRNCACGASILNTRWGLTAAHCVRAAGHNLKTLTIRSGSSYCNREGTVHTVTKVKVHEKYNRETADYDIAVFSVDPVFRFNSCTRPISLPNKNLRVEDTKWAIVAGWGYYTNLYEPAMPEKLQSVILPKVARAECVNDYKTRFVITPRQVCYGFREGIKDACKGDSGGPLFNRDNIVLGVTSWGDGCAMPYSPGIYTDTISLADWIRNNTRPDHDAALREHSLIGSIVSFFRGIFERVKLIFRFLRNTMTVLAYLFRIILCIYRSSNK